METSKFKSLAILIIILCEIGAVMAFSVGSSIHLNINVSNSSDGTVTPTINNSSIITNTTDSTSNNTDLNSDTNSQDDSTNQDNTQNNQASSSSTDSHSNPRTIIIHNNPSSDDSETQEPSTNIDQDNPDNLMTAAAVSSNSGISNSLKIASTISTVFLAAVFIFIYIIYRRKEDKFIIENENIKKEILKKPKNKVKKHK